MRANHKPFLPLDAGHFLLRQVGVVLGRGVLMPKQGHEAVRHHERAEVHGGGAWGGLNLLGAEGDIPRPARGGDLPGPLSPFGKAVVGAHSAGWVCVESSVVLHSTIQGIPMRLDVFGGGLVDAKASKRWPGLACKCSAYHWLAPPGGGGYPIFYNGCTTYYISDESIEELFAYGCPFWGH